MELSPSQRLPRIWRRPPHERATPLASHEDASLGQIQKVPASSFGRHLMAAGMRHHSDLSGSIIQRELNQRQLPVIEVLVPHAKQPADVCPLPHLLIQLGLQIVERTIQDMLVVDEEVGEIRLLFRAFIVGRVGEVTQRLKA